jgi:transposase
MSTTMIGLDLAKNVFQIHGIDAKGEVTVQRQLRRAQVVPFFAKLGPCVVGMEACGGAHHWARTLQGLGHEVRMMPAHYVKPYVKRNKNDSRDAEAICEAMSRPTMRFIPPKSEEAQAMLAMHRTRALLVRQRTMAGNALRANLAEFGIVAAQGNAGLRTLMEQLVAPTCPLPASAQAALALLAGQWAQVDIAVRELEVRIVRSAREQEAARRLMEIPGVGPLGATAILAKVADASVFRTARDFAAWLGLTPRESGTGGKQRSGGISKQGDHTLRQLLIMGARSRLNRVRTNAASDPWLRDLMARRPIKVVVVALAAKMARVIWALLKTGERYRAKDQRAAGAAVA